MTRRLEDHLIINNKTNGKAHVSNLVIVIVWSKILLGRSAVVLESDELHSSESDSASFISGSTVQVNRSMTSPPPETMSMKSKAELNR